MWSFSWTGSLDVARWFAGRAAYANGLADPAVFVATVPRKAVLFRARDRNEDEYVLDCAGLRPRRLERVSREAFERISEARQEAERKRWAKFGAGRPA